MCCSRRSSRLGRQRTTVFADNNVPDRCHESSWHLTSVKYVEAGHAFGIVTPPGVCVKEALCLRYFTRLWGWEGLHRRHHAPRLMTVGFGGLSTVPGAQPGHREWWGLRDPLQWPLTMIAGGSPKLPPCLAGETVLEESLTTKACPSEHCQGQWRVVRSTSRQTRVSDHFNQSGDEPPCRVKAGSLICVRCLVGCWCVPHGWDQCSTSSRS